MAKDNIEVEIKIALSKSEFDQLFAKISQEGTFVHKATQIDEYFTPKHRNFMAPQYPYEWLRLRKKNNKAQINYKHWYPPGAEVTTYCDEFETEVGDIETVEKIFKAIDIKPFIKLENERQVFIYHDQFEIALDIVKDLGYFIEIEALQNEKTPKETFTKISDFARELGLDPTKSELRGYPYMLMKKQGLINS